MEVVLKFKANDGVIYNSEAEANKADMIFDICEEMNKQLPDEPENFREVNGYLQCDKVIVDNLKELFLKTANAYFKPTTPFIHFDGIVGRYISDSGTQAFNKIYFRLSCIDSNYRMWHQVYFRLNPQKANKIKMN